MSRSMRERSGRESQGSSRCVSGRVAVMVVAMGLAASVQAQSEPVSAFPSKPMRVIVPFAPGGPTDVLARLLSAALQEGLKQPAIVDFRSGAGGLIGFDMVAKAAPDGYTLLMAGDSLTIKPALFAKPPFDPVRDFAPVMQIGVTPFVIVTHPSLPVRTVPELIALAKSKPGALQFGSAGVGVSSHLSGELFRFMAGIDVLHVPYKGQAPASTALLGGEISFMLNNPVVALPLVRAGKLRAIAVTGSRRSALLPDVPAVAESLPGYESGTWSALQAPAGTPGDIIRKLNAEAVRHMGSADTRNRMAELGIEPVLGTPEQLAQLIRTDTAKWARVVKQAGVPLE
jgi:tripartite-type tricarboxylate transporter receptor subunit TctC